MSYPELLNRSNSRLNGTQRHGVSPKTSTTPTFGQLLRGEDPSKGSTSNATPTFGKEYDLEEDHSPGQQKKSVLAKVKEKARKWRNTLSKKKHGEENNTTPSWGVSLDEDEDDDEDNEDPEYLGAPMYESEMAPEGYKKPTREYSKSAPGTSEKHVLPSSVSHVATPEKHVFPSSASHAATPEKHVLPSSVSHAATPEKYVVQSSSSHAVTPKKHVLPSSIGHAAGQKFPREKQPAVGNAAEAQRKDESSMTVSLAHNVTEKLEPAFAAISDATISIASKVQDLTLSAAEALAPAHPPPSNSEQKDPLGSIEARQAALAPVAVSQGEPASAPTSGYSSTTEHIWDKGVSVKEYIMNKLEPGEDEKALSQVISQAISPKKSPGDKTVVDKLRDAVTSLLNKEESSQRTIYHSAHSSYSHIPVSTNAHEVLEEENHGRIPQAN